GCVVVCLGCRCGLLVVGFHDENLQKKLVSLRSLCDSTSRGGAGRSPEGHTAALSRACPSNRRLQEPMAPLSAADARAPGGLRGRVTAPATGLRFLAGGRHDVNVYHTPIPIWR